MSGINKLPLISVITVCYNAAQFIKQTIRSVLAQSYPLIEYIIIDGGSTDGTVEIIKKYESQLVYWHSKPDRGLAHAFNLGQAQARGEWIIYLNSDDFFLDNSVIEQMVPHLVINKTADVVFGRVMSVSRQQVATPLPLRPIYYGHRWCWEEFCRENTIPHQGAFTNRNYFKKVGNFDESLRFVIDYEFYLRTGRCLKALFIPINASAMRVGGISGNDQIYDRERERRIVRQKVGGLPKMLCWYYFLRKIIKYYPARLFHNLMDPYAERFSFKNRLSGDLMKSPDQLLGLNLQK